MTTTYEVHFSREVGVIEERVHNHVAVDEHSFAVATRPGSLFIRTSDHALAEHVAEVHEATARRADDRHAWVREVS